MALDGNLISFRPLTHEHLPLLQRWLNEPHVQAWYRRGPASLPYVIDKYGARIDGRLPTFCYLILYDGQPIGHIQTYRIADYPDYHRHLGCGDNAAGLDLLIGDRAFVGRGLGSLVILRFLNDVIFATLPVDSCVTSPHPGNIASVRAFEKAGFCHLKTIVNTDDNEPEHVMQLTRQELSHVQPVDR
jgi:RimJ/RimL family protein N-acetyltransferase